MNIRNPKPTTNNIGAIRESKRKVNRRKEDKKIKSNEMSKMTLSTLRLESEKQIKLS
jgi:hypothetical protein